MLIKIKLFWLLPLVLNLNFNTHYCWVNAFIHDENDIVMLSNDPSAICPVGYFQCNASRQCVVQRMNCDGSVDCPDSTDELDCVDEVDANFWDSLYRKQPYGRDDYLKMGICIWPPENLSCPCRGDQILCSHQNLKMIPKNLPENNVALIDFSHNNFSHLSRKFFEYLPMTDELILTACQISAIDSDAFKSFSMMRLKTLFLNGNYIETLNGTLFRNENVVRTLILSDNRIKFLSITNFMNLDQLIQLDLRGNRIEFFDAKVFEPLKSLQILYLNDNRLRQLNSKLFPNMNNLNTLSLVGNKIESIERNSFPFPKLENLYLSGNLLTHIQGFTFCNLTLLRYLNLDHNLLQNFDLDAFDCLGNLESLLLNDNKFKALDKELLQNVTKLDYIYFTWFHLCRFALHVRACEPKSDGISSAYHLLDSVILRGSVWIMAFIAIMGNLFVGLGRFMQNTRSNAVHSLYLRHLAASDFLMGIYLAIIASADIRYRGNYIMHEDQWLHSDMCALSGFLSTFSCQASTLLLTLVTWDRLMSVKRPLKLREAGRKRVTTRLIMLWSIALCVAAAPFIPSNYFGKYFYGNNGVCLSLHIHDPYSEGWEYSAMLFICINTLSLIIIIISYTQMYKAIQKSGSSIRSTLNDRESVVTTRFILIIITDCACWVPIIVVKLAALMGLSIGPSLYAWLAVLVLPVNSALNPVLYTLTTSVFKQQLSRYCHDLPTISALLGCGTTSLPKESPITTSLTQTGSCKSNLERQRCSQKHSINFV